VPLPKDEIWKEETTKKTKKGVPLLLLPSVFPFDVQLPVTETDINRHSIISFSSLGEVFTVHKSEKFESNPNRIARKFIPLQLSPFDHLK
jgi:hypothetical protein